MPGQEGILDSMEALEIRGRRRSSQPLYFLAATTTILFEKGDQAAILTLVRPAWVYADKPDMASSTDGQRAAVLKTTRFRAGPLSSLTILE